MSAFFGRIRQFFSNLFHRSPPISISHGCYCFNGWASPRPEFGLVPGVQCPTATPWADMKTRDRVPLLGEYDERDPAVTAKRIEWMRQGKIDYACYQTEWRHDTHELLMAHCADNHNPIASVKYCLNFFDVLAGSSDSYLPTMPAEAIEASIRAYGQAVARHMSKPSYFNIDGRPVLFRGYANNLAYYARFGFSPARILDMVSAEVLAVVGRKPYLVATCCDPAVYAQLKGWGFDAFTEYLLYSDSWPNVLATYRDRWSQAIAICKTTGVDYWIPATAGYNSAAWGSPVKDVFMPTPAESTAHLKEARAFARANAEYTRGQVITYAWNEFGEGGIIEPMAAGMIRNGDEMLRAHAAAVTP